MCDDYLPPLDPDLAAAFRALSSEAQEYFSERAAVIQWDGGFSRAEAEVRAMAETRTWQERRAGR